MTDYQIILTADRSFMSDYHLLPFLKGLRFASTRILDPSIFFRLVSPQVPSTREGLALLAPYHTRRTEAALLEHGFDENEIATVTPDNVRHFIGPSTKIISITVRDPLRKIHHYSFLNPSQGETYSSLTFKKLIENLRRKKQGFQVVVEGPGAWQLANAEDMHRFGIDYVIVGEYTTSTIAHIFDRILRNEQVPSIFYAPTSDISGSPLVRGGVVEGIIEVARGCNRSCHFCTATKLQCRPLKDIVAETHVNVQHGQRDITLRSDDILSYQVSGVKVNREAVLNLYKSVAQVEKVKQVSQCYISLASAVSEPSLIKEISDITGVGCRENPYTTAFTGIETGCSRLIERHMPGKSSPFKPSEWPSIVEQGFSILHESHWVPLGMLILGLPGETEHDVNESITLVEKLKNFKSILIPFAFDAKGSLNQKETFYTKNLKRCHLELLKKIFSHNIFWGRSLIKEKAHDLSMPRWLFPLVSPFVDWAIKKACRRLSEEAATFTTKHHS